MTQHKKPKEDWMNSKWRPMMGWMYMCVCMCDFMLFPILWSLLQSLSHGQVTSQWQPLTLQGAGLFHIAMGAVLGIAAYGRTQEKLGGANNGGIGQTGQVSVNNQPTTISNNGFDNGFNQQAKSSFTQPTPQQSINNSLSPVISSKSAVPVDSQPML
jgi:hypothetical protein